MSNWGLRASLRGPTVAVWLELQPSWFLTHDLILLSSNVTHTTCHMARCDPHGRRFLTSTHDPRSNPNTPSPLPPSNMKVARAIVGNTMTQAGTGGRANGTAGPCLVFKSREPNKGRLMFWWIVIDFLTFPARSSAPSRCEMAEGICKAITEVSF